MKQRTLGALLTLVIVLRRHWVALGAWVCTVVLSELAIGPVKALVDRPRPPGAEVVTSAASYPSGHAIASAVTAMGIVMALTTGRRRLQSVARRRPQSPVYFVQYPGSLRPGLASFSRAGEPPW